MKNLVLWLSLLLFYAYGMFHGAVSYNYKGFEGAVFSFLVVVIISGIIMIILERGRNK
jgi:hypothetical protein